METCCRALPYYGRAAGSGIGSAIIFKLIDLTIGLRVTTDQEREGLDLTERGERAYTS